MQEKHENVLKKVNGKVFWLHCNLPRLACFFSKSFLLLKHFYTFLFLKKKKLVITKVPKDLPTVKISVGFTLDSIS